MKTGIVLEGGAVRTIFSTGVCDALLTRDLLPDYVCLLYTSDAADE